MYDEQVSIDDSDNMEIISENKNDKKEYQYNSFRKISGTVIFLHSIAGFFGGLLSTIIIVIVYMLGQDIILPLFNSNIAINYLFLVFLIFIIFITTVPTNIVVSWIIIYADRDKYFEDYTYHLKKVFVTNVILFLIFSIIYFIIYSFYSFHMITVLIINIVLSIMFSIFTLESMTNTKFILTSIYGMLLGIFISFIICVMLFAIKQELIIFFGIPVIWGSFSFSSIMMEIFGKIFYQTYGVDFFRMKSYE